MSALEHGNLWSAFRRVLRYDAERPALSAGGRDWTYGRLGAAVGDVARRLRAAGVGPGDRVVLLLGNGVAFPAADLAVMACGAVKTPLNLMLSAEEVRRAVDFVEPSCVVLDDAGAGLAGLLDAALPRVHLGDGWADEPHAAGLPGEVDVRGEAPAALYLSSGTTGRPKGIVHSQESVLHNLWTHLLDSGIGRDERLLLTTPLPHSAGLFTATALLCGAHVRIEPGFDADRWIDLVSEHAVTWSYGVPTMVKRLVDAARARDWRPTTIRTLQYGSAPMSPGLLAEALDVFGPVMQQLYAQTECPQYATLLRKEDHARAATEPGLLASAGRPVTMCEVSVRDDSGAELPPGEVGEVCLRSPYVMSGYWRDPDGFAARFHGSWLRTGDVGRQDERGYLYLVDRLADMVVSGGMNVYSMEVEAALSTHPSVRQVAVIGVPHEEWGEAVHAVVVPAPGASGSREALHAELDAHCRPLLAAYKRPKAYEVVEEIPLTTYGKPDKKELRMPYWSDQERAIS